MFQLCCTTYIQFQLIAHAHSTVQCQPTITDKDLVTYLSPNVTNEYEASHHFRGCSPGLADGDVLTMETSLEWPYTLMLLTQVIALQFI